MPKVSKTEVDKDLRELAFNDTVNNGNTVLDWKKINDRQYGMIIKDINGDTRYVRIGAIVAELREDMTAEELMQSEIDAFTQKQADKAEKAKKKAEKIAADKAKRKAERAEEDD